MVKDSNPCGIIFRMRNPHNFYSLEISQKHEYKRVIKAVNGSYKLLHEIKDGGILQSLWFKVQITGRKNNFIIKFCDTSQFSSYEQLPIVFNFYDNTHVRGTVGVFVNGNPAFYFDNMNVVPLSCWTPYEPKLGIKIITDRANVYDEDYNGDLKKKYKVNDPINKINGPSEWGFSNGKENRETVIMQKSNVADKSYNKEPTQLILKDKYIRKGTLSVDLLGKNKGRLGLSFKYVDENNYYLFEVGGGHKKQNRYFQLRKKINGKMKLMKRINSNKELSEEERKKSKDFGFLTQTWYSLRIHIDGPKMKFFFNKKGNPEKSILNYEDDDIPYGLIGVSSSKTAGLFDNLQIRPLSEPKKDTFNPSDSALTINPDDDLFGYDAEKCIIIYSKI